MSIDRTWSLFEEAKLNNTDAISQLKKLVTTSPLHSQAINVLGVCYECGYAIDKNLTKAAELYRQAADLGDDIAMCNLGLAYQAGRGVETDLSWSAYWYLEAAKKRTTNTNGTLRATRELKKLAKVTPLNIYVISSLAVCYENGYGISKNYHKAEELYFNAGIHNLTQNNLRKKLGYYLRNKNRDPEFIQQFENNGHCAGLTFLYLYAKWLQSQPVRLDKDHKPLPRDDFDWLLKLINRAVDWDGKSPLNQEDDIQFERLISLMAAFQAGWYGIPISQGEFQELFGDTQGRKLEQEYSIGSCFTKNELSTLLSEIVQENKFVTLVSDCHYVGFIKIRDEFYFIDSESPLGVVSVPSIDDLSQRIFSSYFYVPEQTSPLALSIFNVNDKVSNKNEIEFVYPHQKTLLKDLYIFQPSNSLELDSAYASGHAALHRVCWIGCEASIQFIMERYSDREYINKKSTNGYTSLMYAAQNGKTKAVMQLCDAGADVNLLNNNQHSAIVLASMNGFKKTVIQLIENGANQKDLALTVAAREGHIDTVNELIKNGANVNHVASDRWTPLTLAAKGGHPNVVRILLENGADINLVGKDGLSALNLAIQYGHIQTVEHLISHRLDCYEKDLAARREAYKPLLPIFSFFYKGYSKRSKQDALKDLREAIHEKRAVQKQHLGALNNRRLGDISEDIKKCTSLKLGLGL